MSGCLVTDEISFDYEEENVPPVILDVPGTKTAISDIIYFNVDSPATITFEFRVRDENIGQPLTARHQISYQQLGGVFVPQDKAESFAIAQEYQPIRISSFYLREDSFRCETCSCYRIDLAVTFKFKVDEDEIHLYNWDEPADKDDIARARWYVVTGEEIGCEPETRYE